MQVWLAWQEPKPATESAEAVTRVARSSRGTRLSVEHCIRYKLSRNWADFQVSETLNLEVLNRPIRRENPAASIMSHRISDVVIAGGGVIGLSLAYELASRKLRVSLLERGQIGQESSWAGAGILAPQAEMEEAGPLAQLLLASRKIYPDFVRDVSSRSGTPVNFSVPGLIYIALTSQQQEQLQHRKEHQTTLGLTVQELSREEVLKLEDGLSPETLSALYFPNEGYVNNRELVEALRIACLRLGVELVCGCHVVSVGVEGAKALGFHSNLGFWPGAQVVLAAGSWSGQIVTGLPYTLPVRPARGQIVVIKSSFPPLKHVVYSPDCYLVPRSDGRVLLGSTVEWVGYDNRVTLEGIQGITAAAIAVSPAIRTSTFLTCWAGLRPFCEGGLPILGSTEIEGLYVATGHFRNGLLLAPITAKLMAELIVTRETPKLLESFTPLRFK
jgi:glycine oxidase